MTPDAAATAHGHDGGHEQDHHTGMHHDSATDEPSPSDCTTDCDCGHCLVAVALTETERAAAAAYGSERIIVRAEHLGPFLDGIFRPPTTT